VFIGLTIFGLAAILVAGTATFLYHPQTAQASRTQNFTTSWWYQHRGEGSGTGLEDKYSDNTLDGAAAAQLAGDVAYPATNVGADQMLGAQNAYKNLYNGWGTDDDRSAWKPVGPNTSNVSDFWTYTGNPSITSGRITALGIGSVCRPGDCRLYLGAAGGGVWRTDDALANPPAWKSVSLGLFTNAIGSLWVDPKNSRHVLVGTGEPNGSSDSEAGVGLFQTFDGGNFWFLVPGSLAAAKGRSIAGIAVDPANPFHIFIGTALARHGSSSVNGGRFTPPNAPTLGLYESNNGGLSFKLVFSRPGDVVNPASPNGSDFFRGGVTNVQFDPTTAGRVYLSIFDYGLYRSDGHGGYEQVFASAGGGSVANSLSSRTEFALAPLGNGKLRVYVGDTGAAPAELFRVDDASVAASTLTNGTTNPGWLALSSATPGDPGFASYDFCGGQCSYDMPVASPKGHPDNVWIGGQMQYAEFFGPSNGRTIQRSTTAGASFTDMTNDQQFNGMHPDQHAIVFDPENADIAFTGSDGGLVRTSGSFGPDAIPCSSRPISGADLTDCNNWLSQVPTLQYNMNAGLQTLQFQSLAVNAKNPKDIQGGTQDNGTLLNYGSSTTWTETVGGDGGQSGINVSNPNIRFHSFFAPQHDVNFKNGDPQSWDWIADPLGNNEAASFYVPMIYDPNPAKAATIFEGERHIFRTTDNGGPQTDLDQHCNEFTGDALHPPFVNYRCGDWVPMGGAYVDPTVRFPVTHLNDAGDLTGTHFGTDKGGSYVVAISRAPSNTNTLWAGTRRGRLFISANADAADASTVSYTRIDLPTTTPGTGTPTRFISGIAVDPSNPNHAFVSFSGYDAYAVAAGTATGHVFDVTYNPGTHSATWTDISKNIGDQPITGIAWDSVAKGLYISTDFTVLKQGKDGNWRVAAPGLPLVATYGLTIDSNAGVLYAATHGRSAWRLDLPR
jgi:hypothetical protein